MGKSSKGKTLEFEHPHFIVFRTRLGSRYVYDAATASVHPLCWSITGEQLAEVYAARDETALASVAESLGLPDSFLDYVGTWRRTANAFVIPNESCQGCGSSANVSATSWTASPSALSNLLLVVTRNCNLRCAYCIYSGHYEGFPVLHGSVMSWETARKAVDCFFELNDTSYFRSLPERKLDVGFYGGEPLLAADLIKRVVQYARSAYRGPHNLRFSFSTNLSCLTDEMARFLVDHQIGVQCSLDGPEQEHDQYRRFASGEGTFKTVWRNIEKLRKLDEDYFRENVQVLVTVNGNTDLDAVMAFFDDPENDTPPIAFVNLIRDLSTGSFHEQYPYDRERLEKANRRVIDEYVARKRKGIPVPEGSFLYHFIDDALVTVYGRLMRTGHSCGSHYTGACQPGRRLTVSHDGRFHMCERISEHFPIGSVDEGLDLEKCVQVMDAYYSSLPSCGTCWARQLCHLCFAIVADNGRFCFSDTNCKMARTIALDKLALLYSVLEEAPESIEFGDPLVDRHKLMGCP